MFGSSKSPFGAPFGVQTPFGTTTSSSTSVFGTPSTSSLFSNFTSPFTSSSVPGVGSSSSSSSAFSANAFGPTANAIPVNVNPIFAFKRSSNSASFGPTANATPVNVNPLSAFKRSSNSASSSVQGENTAVDRRHGSDIWSGFARYSTNPHRPFTNLGPPKLNPQIYETHSNPFSNRTMGGGTTDTHYAPAPGEENFTMMSVSCLPVYCGKSHEELRWENYQLRSQGFTSSGATSTTASNLFNSDPFTNNGSSPFSNTSAQEPFNCSPFFAKHPIGPSDGSFSFSNRTGQEPYNSNPYTKRNPFCKPLIDPSSASFFSSNRNDQGSFFSTPFSKQSLFCQPFSSAFGPDNNGSFFPNGTSQTPFALRNNQHPSSTQAAPTFLQPRTCSCAASWSHSGNTFYNACTQQPDSVTSFSACKPSNSCGGSTTSIKAKFGQTTDPSPAAMVIKFRANNSGQSKTVLEISTPHPAGVGTSPVGDQLGIIQQAASQLLNFIISKPGEVCPHSTDGTSHNNSKDMGKETVSLNPNESQTNTSNNNSAAGCKEFHLMVPDLESAEVTPDAAADGWRKKLSVETTPKLQRSDYYTVPAISELQVKEDSEPGFMSSVPKFVVGRIGYGCVEFEGETDVRGLDLDSLILFNARELRVYMEGTNKPPVGQGLNKPALVTLVNVKCLNKNTGEEYTEGEKVKKYKEMLKKAAEQQGAQFVSYDPVAGEWKFRVQHF